MNNSLFNFKDDEEREMFFIAIPVIALFTLLGAWLMKGETPSLSTPVAAVGVTDTDGDGMTDGTDHCPTVSGELASFGCPAKVAWENKDNDLDGIRNGIDSCTETKGVAANNGCAAVAAVAAPVVVEEIVAEETITIEPVDTDGDGIIDDNDECPTEAGINGNACPIGDTDNDGVLDDADECPDTMGSALSNGCPADTDGDGFNDMNDNCPSIAGTEEGCPLDTDADGVPDASDICPAEAGLKVNNGCPADADGDGITDANDQCPDTAGVEAAGGCPAVVEADTDADGIVDTVDNCPSIKGVAENSGCPEDTDGDGVADSDDKCPSTAGAIELLGCPTETAPVIASNNEVKQALDAAISGVKFNSSSAVLTASSRDLLRTVADLMKKYPDSFLEIRGHTDSSGNSQTNMDLSMQRARSCASFIAAQGISLDRLKAYGYGDSLPIADNSTRAGREQNRRVEFELGNL